MENNAISEKGLSLIGGGDHYRYFTAHFGEFLENQESMDDVCVYRIDSTSGLLRTVGEGQ